MAQGALVSGAAISDRVVVTDTAAIRSLSALTYLFYCYPTTITANRRMMSKVGSPSFVGPDLMLTGASGFIEFDVSRVTTGAVYVTNSLPLSVNKWWLVAATFDSAATPSGH